MICTHRLQHQSQCQTVVQGKQTHLVHWPPELALHWCTFTNDRHTHPLRYTHSYTLFLSLTLSTPINIMRSHFSFIFYHVWNGMVEQCAVLPYHGGRTPGSIQSLCYSLTCSLSLCTFFLHIVSFTSKNMPVGEMVMLSCPKEWMYVCAGYHAVD